MWTAASRARCPGPLLLLLFAVHASAQESGLSELLGVEVLAPRSAVEEVLRYCGALVPAMPQVETREQWEAIASQLQREMLDRVVFRGRATIWRDAPTRVEWLESIAGGDGYRIRKLRFEALPGLWIPALLYEPEDLTAKAPVVLNVNGHEPAGKSAPYKQIRCINQAKRGMVALNVEWLGMGQLRREGLEHYRMNQLDLCGTSGLAPFYLSMVRSLDVLLAHAFADPQRVAVAGLSGGGWQTILISALDPRVTLANPVAGYSSFVTRIEQESDLGDSEQTPCDMATVADYTHLTALRAPRPTLLTYNAQDNCCFAADHALSPLLAAAQPIYGLYEAGGALCSHVNHDPGTHNFERDNRQKLYEMFGKFFYRDVANFSSAEIACDDEVKSAAELDVELPPNNADFQSLARELARELPLQGIPATPDETWRTRRIELLVQTVKAKQYDLIAVESHVDVASVAAPLGVQSTFWRLYVGEKWTIPAVELRREKHGGGDVEGAGAEEFAIVIADGGRTSTVDAVADLLDSGKRVLAVDLFAIGESQLGKLDYLLALLVGAVGDRPLGLQASQLAAIARWLKSERHAESVVIAAQGQRMTLAALVAACLERDAIDSLRLEGCVRSLKELIENNDSVKDKPEMFCFGLLQHFDIDVLLELIAPRKVH